MCTKSAESATAFVEYSSLSGAHVFLTPITSMPSMLVSLPSGPADPLIALAGLAVRDGVKVPAEDVRGASLRTT